MAAIATVNSDTTQMTVNGILKLTNALAIADGGTGATNKKDAVEALLSHGKNSLKESEDNGTYWANKGFGFWHCNVAGCLSGQPSVYGSMLCLAGEGKLDISQIFVAQASGETFTRSSNNATWSPWRKQIDNTNIADWHKCGTSATPSGEKYGIYIQY